jgi:hypothetical protein
MADLTLLGPQRTNRPAFRFRTRLEGEFWAFRLVWNTRVHAWFLDVISADGVDLVTGLRIAEGLDLLGAFSDTTLPPGQLFVVDDSGLHRDPPRNAWTEGWRLKYRPTSDVQAAAGTADEVR